MSDLVIVSNRGPFSFSRGFLTETEDSLRSGVYPKPLEFGEGGLVQAMASLLKPGKWRPTWIGASMGDRDIESPAVTTAGYSLEWPRAGTRRTISHGS
jgi:hypothetical protein